MSSILDGTCYFFLLLKVFTQKGDKHEEKVGPQIPSDRGCENDNQGKINGAASAMRP